MQERNLYQPRLNKDECFIDKDGNFIEILDSDLRAVKSFSYEVALVSYIHLMKTKISYAKDTHD